jgi:LL-diaminopimelate aminotransferase
LLLLLQPEGLKEMYGLINFYKENAAILKNTFQEMGFEVYGEHQAANQMMTSSSTT